MKQVSYISAVAVTAALATTGAYACSNPTGVEGQQIYNSSFDVMQYCDGDDWIAMAGDGNNSTVSDASSVVSNGVIFDNGSNVQNTQSGFTFDPDSGNLTLPDGGEITNASGGTLVSSTPGAGDGDWTVSGPNAYRTTGSVGIGTTNPSGTPNQNGIALFSDGNIEMSADGNNYNFIDFTKIDSTDTTKDFDGRIFYTHVEDDMIFSTDGAERFRIDNVGNIGIGTAAPSVKLDVNGTAKATMFDLGLQRKDNLVVIGPGEIDSVSQTCSAPQKILYGGCSFSGFDSRLTQSYPTSDTSWSCRARNNNTNDHTLLVGIVCANIQ